MCRPEVGGRIIHRRREAAGDRRPGPGAGGRALGGIIDDIALKSQPVNDDGGDSEDGAKEGVVVNTALQVFVERAAREPQVVEAIEADHMDLVRHLVGITGLTNVADPQYQKQLKAAEAAGRGDADGAAAAAAAAAQGDAPMAPSRSWTRSAGGARVGASVCS